MNNFLTPRLYIGAVIAAGAGLLLYLAPRHLENPVIAGALLVTTLVLSIFKLRLPLGNGVSTMSMAYAVDFVALIIEGANLAMFLGAIGVLIQCTVRVRRKQPIHRAAFSAAAVIIAVQVAGWGWTALGGSLTTLTLTEHAAAADGVRDHLLHRQHLARRRRHRRHVVGVAGAGLEPGILVERPGVPGLRRRSPAWSPSPSPTACSSCCRLSPRRSMSATAAITAAGARWRRRCSTAPRSAGRPSPRSSSGGRPLFTGRPRSSTPNLQLPTPKLRTAQSHSSNS